MPLPTLLSVPTSLEVTVPQRRHSCVQPPIVCVASFPHVNGAVLRPGSLSVPLGGWAFRVGHAWVCVPSTTVCGWCVTSPIQWAPGSSSVGFRGLTELTFVKC